MKAFIDRVEQYAVVYGWREEQKFLYASTRLEGVPKLWYGSVCTTQCVNWTQFAEKIKSKFAKEIDVHFNLSHVRKMASESYLEFAYRINAIAANNQIAEPSAIKYIITALAYDRIYPGISKTRFNTLDEFTAQLQYCEMLESVQECKRKPKSGSFGRPYDKSPQSSTLRCFG